MLAEQLSEQSGHGGWSVQLCDSLEKVFADERPRPLDQHIPVVLFCGESASVQVAVRPPAAIDATQVGPVRVVIDALPGVQANVSAVELVPVEVAARADVDEHYLHTTPGLYPDLLRPAADGVVRVVPGQWRAAWVELVADSDAPAQSGTVSIRTYRQATGELLEELEVPVQVVAVPLPELEIHNAQWLHCDGLANYYQVDVFSEQHWQLVDRFLASARGVSTNTVLTPVWTPPLDTGVGLRRTVTQLVGIEDRGGEQYEFDFSQLRRWIASCREHGYRTLEMPHLFTQWGAQATPSIMVRTPSGTEERFGWHVPADDPRYRTFLEQLLPQLRAVLEAEWGLDRVIFHISDEPSAANVADYRRSAASVADLLAGCTVIDAISDYALYADGAVPVPVVATDHAEEFLEAGVPVWLYYCVAQGRDVANRFITLPSVRNRVFGTQLFLTGARGLLHWGFNFYNAFHSTHPVDPFRDTCAGGGFPGGDAFLVYPGPDGKPWLSIRYVVLAEAMTDYRAMQLLAARAGRERVRQIVDPDGRITLRDYSYDPNDYRRVLHELAEALVDGPGTASTRTAGDRA